MAVMTAAAVARATAELQAALARRDRAAANRAVRALLDGGAPLGGQWRGLAQLMQVSGEWTLAHRAIDAFIAAAGETAQARFAKVVLLIQSGRPREAHDLLATLPPDVPDRAGHAYFLGNAAMQLGRVEAATDHLCAALDHRPGWGSAWLSLATMLDLADHPLGDRLVAEEPAAMRQPPADAARYRYALGKLHADGGDHVAAVAAFARGAALLRSQASYSRAADAANARSAMTGYPAGFLDRIAPRPSRDTGRPIFVTGLPRSGTTLVEQILTSHGAVRDGGELNIVQHLAVAAGGVSGDHLAGGGSVEALGDLYLHLLAERCGPTGRIVDKTLDASRCLGLIAASLPDAPLIWLRRDPLDNAWSAFRTFFMHGSGWSYDLADIAHHFRLEDELASFWQDRLGGRLLVVPYGELVADPARWTARLLAHCGLADEPGVHTPHLTARAVTSASTAQVRRPINRDGLGVAAPYRTFLQPFVDAYEGPMPG